MVSASVSLSLRRDGCLSDLRAANQPLKAGEARPLLVPSLISAQPPFLFFPLIIQFDISVMSL
jgi:hypothetical protein